jgi:hypothetical protein
LRYTSGIGRGRNSGTRVENLSLLRLLDVTGIEPVHARRTITYRLYD